MKSQFNGDTGSILSDAKRIILEGRIRETKHIPRYDEYNNEILKVNRIESISDLDNIAIAVNKGTYFSKKRRKERVQQLRRFIPSSSTSIPNHTHKPLSSNKTRIRRLFLIANDPKHDYLVRSSDEYFSTTQQLAALVLHDDKSVDDIRIFRYTLEYVPNTALNFDSQVFKLTGWSIDVHRQITRINGYLRQVKTNFNFHKYYSKRAKIYELGCKINSADEGGSEFDEMIQHAGTIKQNLLSQVDNMVIDISKEQSRRQQEIDQLKLLQNVINQMTDLQKENSRLREFLFEEEHKNMEIEENKNKEIEEKAEENSEEIINEQVSKKTMPDPQSPNTKDNQQEITADEALGILQAVTPKKYTRNDKDNEPRHGFIAQELEAAIGSGHFACLVGITELIDDEIQPMKSVDYARLTAILWTCVRDLHSKVQDLQNASA